MDEPGAYTLNWNETGCGGQALPWSQFRAELQACDLVPDVISTEMANPAGHTFAAIPDMSGSPVALVEEGGQLLERYSYDSWGARTLHNPEGATVCDSTTQDVCASSYGNHRGFTGAPLSSYSGLYDLRNRQYDPHLRRFLSPDPMGYVDGYDVWQYSGGDPINYFDPFGLQRKGAGKGKWGTKPDKSWERSGIDASEANAVSDQLRKNMQLQTMWDNGARFQVGGSGDCPVALCIDGRKSPEAGHGTTLSGEEDELALIAERNLMNQSIHAMSEETVGAGVQAYHDAVTGELILAGGVGMIGAALKFASVMRKLIKLRRYTKKYASYYRSAAEARRGYNGRPLGRGTTGRKPSSLEEKLAVQSAISDPTSGRELPIAMSDSRWPAGDGWVKMQKKTNGINVHYVRNKITGAIDDFKIKDVAATPSGPNILDGLSPVIPWGR